MPAARRRGCIDVPARVTVGRLRVRVTQSAGSAIPSRPRRDLKQSRSAPPRHPGSALDLKPSRVGPGQSGDMSYIFSRTQPPGSLAQTTRTRKSSEYRNLPPEFNAISAAIRTIRCTSSRCEHFRIIICTFDTRNLRSEPRTVANAQHPFGSHRLTTSHGVTDPS
jgi:hypothetical protein